jgi:hypothetical protein
VSNGIGDATGRHSREPIQVDDVNGGDIDENVGVVLRLNEAQPPSWPPAVFSHIDAQACPSEVEVRPAAENPH